MIVMVSSLIQVLFDNYMFSRKGDAILENMDVTEKLMLIEELSLTKEQREQEKKDAISLEQALMEAGLTVDDLQN